MISTEYLKRDQFATEDDWQKYKRDKGMISRIPNPKVPGTYVRVDDLPQNFPLGGVGVPTSSMAPAFAGTVEPALSPSTFVDPETVPGHRREWQGHIAQFARDGKLRAGTDVPMGQSLYFLMAATGRADGDASISLADLYAGSRMFEHPEALVHNIGMAAFSRHLERWAMANSMLYGVKNDQITRVFGMGWRREALKPEVIEGYIEGLADRA